MIKRKVMIWIRLLRRLVAVRLGQLLHWCNVTAYLDDCQHTLGLLPTIEDHIAETSDPNPGPGRPPKPFPDDFDYKNWAEVEAKFKDTHGWFTDVAEWMKSHELVHSVSGVELAEFPATYQSVPEGLQDLLEWLNDPDTGAWNWLHEHRAASGSDPDDPPPPPPPFGGD
jgi:hypothetical protein